MRAPFQPSAYLIGHKTRPEQIVIYGVTGGPERWLRIPLDITRAPVTFVVQALAVVRNTPRVPFFGDTRGFAINYREDYAVVFDVTGNPVDVVTEGYAPGRVQVEIAGRDVLASGVASRLGLTHDCG